MDDGTPFRLSLGLGEDGSVTSSGKVPSTLDVAELSTSLTKEVGEGIEQSVLPPSNAGWNEASLAGAAALGKLRSGELALTEDSLALSGVATPDGKAEAEALIAALPEGVSGTSAIELYDDGEPFSLEMVKSEAGTTASGKFPAELAATDVVGDAPQTDIRNAFISDETGGFAAAVANGVEGLASLDEGKLSVVGTDISLTGVAKTPTEADAANVALNSLPEG